jgi:hypothetical protein
MDRTPFMNSGSKAVILIEIHAIGSERLAEFDKELQKLLNKSEYALDANQPDNSPQRGKPRRLVTLVTGVPPLDLPGSTGGPA